MVGRRSRPKVSGSQYSSAPTLFLTLLVPVEAIFLTLSHEFWVAAVISGLVVAVLGTYFMRKGVTVTISDEGMAWSAFGMTTYAAEWSNVDRLREGRFGVRVTFKTPAIGLKLGREIAIRSSNIAALDPAWRTRPTTMAVYRHLGTGRVERRT